MYNVDIVEKKNVYGLINKKIYLTFCEIKNLYYSQKMYQYFYVCNITSFSWNPKFCSLFVHGCGNSTKLICFICQFI